MPTVTNGSSANGHEVVTVAINGDSAVFDPDGNAIDASTLNDTALLTAAIAFVRDMDGATTSFGAAADLTLASGVTAVDREMGKISKALGSMAAGIAALKGHQGTLYALSANAEAAAARIQDTDFARSSANLAKFSILNQSAMAMVAQANQANAAVLAVLN